MRWAMALIAVAIAAPSIADAQSDEISKRKRHITRTLKMEGLKTKKACNHRALKVAVNYAAHNRYDFTDASVAAVYRRTKVAVAHVLSEIRSACGSSGFRSRFKAVKRIEIIGQRSLSSAKWKLKHRGSKLTVIIPPRNGKSNPPLRKMLERKIR